ncbi:MAG: PadR family transcriptional regulator [Candidatus Bathyarchaeota archaeon]|nr:PadR family transcriptional regulator [Candidatus Bathyarchaeota archaeon]
MRGLLSFYILWLLSKRRMNGQEICEELKKRRGTKPTAGTIYPALKDLRAKSLVEVEKQGRETIYTLTESGKKELEQACTYFCSAFGGIFENHAEKQGRHLAAGGKTPRRA